MSSIAVFSARLWSVGLFANCPAIRPQEVAPLRDLKPISCSWFESGYPSHKISLVGRLVFRAGHDPELQLVRLILHDCSGNLLAVPG